MARRPSILPSLFCAVLATVTCAAAPAPGAKPEAAAAATRPPPLVLPNTEVRSLTSRYVKDVPYQLYVSLPADYASSTERYPVIYMLDAGYSFAIAHNIVEHLSERANLPKLILVAIAYGGPPAYRINRMRDYSPTHSLSGGYGEAINAHSGGGPAFKQFLKEEVIPFIDQTYRTTPERTLVGHSMGGLFATWTAFTTPELFSSYIIVSPSLWWDGQKIFELEKAYAAGHKALKAKVFMTVGAREHPDMSIDLQAFHKAVRSRQYEGLSLLSTIEPEQNHNTVFPFGLTNGLRFIHGIGTNAP